MKRELMVFKSLIKIFLRPSTVLCNHLIIQPSFGFDNQHNLLLLIAIKKALINMDLMFDFLWNILQNLRQSLVQESIWTIRIQSINFDWSEMGREKSWVQKAYAIKEKNPDSGQIKFNMKFKRTGGLKKSSHKMKKIYKAKKKIITRKLDISYKKRENVQMIIVWDKTSY